MNLLSCILLVFLEIIPKGDAVVKPLHRRDSIYVGDRLELSFEIDNMRVGTELSLVDLKRYSNDTLSVIGDWKLDTIKLRKKKGLLNVKGRIQIVPFEEGDFIVPPLGVYRHYEGITDTLAFNMPIFHVAEFPIDSARVERNELQPIVRYPLTFKEMWPWLAGGIAFLALLITALLIWRGHKRLLEEERLHEPPHITALRRLDKYRGSELWVPEKQKGFYSGVTDTLKAYIEARFGVDAPEMTTAEVFEALKNEKDITPDDYSDAKEMFETADFVKFAKFTAPDEYNAKVVPLAVRFVTDTYQVALEEEQKEDVL